jgi:putative transposase
LCLPPAKKLIKAQRQLPPAESLAVRAFWQSRFYDFNVYSQGKKMEKLNYMHANPVIRGLVEHPKDWPWSSWSVYMKEETGLIRIDILNDRKNPRPRFKNQNRTWGTLRVP